MLGFGRFDLGDDGIDLLVGAIEPVGAPQPMDRPSVALEHGLTQAVTLARGARIMKGGAITFNAEKVTPRGFRVSDGKVNEEAGPIRPGSDCRSFGPTPRRRPRP